MRYPSLFTGVLLLLSIFAGGCVQIPQDYSSVTNPSVINIFDQAMQSKNASLCDSAGGFAARCYDQVARASGDPSLCRPIPQIEPDEGVCLAGPDGEPQDCGAYSYGGFNDDLGKCIAEASNFSITACEGISDGNQREECLIDISTNEGNLTSDYACSLMQNLSDIEECKSTVMGNICSLNSSLCTIQTCLELSFTYLDDCKQILATSRCDQDTSYCGQSTCQGLGFSNASDDDYCISLLAARGCYHNSVFCDPALCSNITDDQATRDDCQLWQIDQVCDSRIKDCNLSLCDDLDNDSLGTCESDVSMRNCAENTDLCTMQLCNSTRTESGSDDCGTGLISKLCQEKSPDCNFGWCGSYPFHSQNSIDQCIWEVSSLSGNYSQCSLISDPLTRDVCFSRAAGQ